MKCRLMELVIVTGIYLMIIVTVLGCIVKIDIDISSYQNRGEYIENYLD